MKRIQTKELTKSEKALVAPLACQLMDMRWAPASHTYAGVATKGKRLTDTEH